MKILITDDDVVSRNMLHAMLLPYGKVSVAEDGKEAIAAFETALDEDRPFDIICLDIEMPEMDGHETLQRMREVEKEMKIPVRKRAKVIMITSARDVQNVMAAKDHCDAYLVKPIKKERLLEEIIRLGKNLMNSK